MPWTIEILDMWHALKSSTWGSWEHWWWHWGPTLRRLSIVLLGRNLPPGFTSIRDSLPSLPPLPPIPKTILIHFRAGQKFCFTTGSPKCRENEKSLERSKLWALDGEALVMDWRRLQLTTVLLVRGATALRAMCNSCVTQLVYQSQRLLVTASKLTSVLVLVRGASLLQWLTVQ